MILLQFQCWLDDNEIDAMLNLYNNIWSIELFIEKELLHTNPIMRIASNA